MEIRFLVTVTSGLCLGCLYQAVDTFEHAVGDARHKPSENPIPMTLDSPGCFDHGLEATMSNPKIPTLQEPFSLISGPFIQLLERQLDLIGLGSLRFNVLTFRPSMMACCLTVRFFGFFSHAKRVFFSSGFVFCSIRRTSSSASLTIFRM